MRNQPWPEFAKWSGQLPTVEAHSRGGRGAFGHYSHGIAGGARVTWSLNIVPMVTSDALRFRAFLHSLRGSGGTFRIRMPAPRVAGGVVSGLQGYSDATLHSDGTPFSDTIDSGVAVETTGTTSGAASAGAQSMTVSGITAVVGSWLMVVTANGPQLLNVISVSGGTVGFRPALRAAVSSGATVNHGPVTAAFRVIGNVPAVPLIVLRSKGFSLECEEQY
jgi:hypothetical protein